MIEWGIRLWGHWSKYTVIVVINNYKFGSMTMGVMVEGG